MLRRDTEYVLTWNAQDHSWLVRPVERKGDYLVTIGAGTTHVDDLALSVSGTGAAWGE